MVNFDNGEEFVITDKWDDTAIVSTSGERVYLNVTENAISSELSLSSKQARKLAKALKAAARSVYGGKE